MPTGEVSREVFDVEHRPDSDTRRRHLDLTDVRIEDVRPERAALQQAALAWARILKWTLPTIEKIDRRHRLAVDPQACAVNTRVDDRRQLRFLSWVERPQNAVDRLA